MTVPKVNGPWAVFFRPQDAPIHSYAARVLLAKLEECSAEVRRHTEWLHANPFQGSGRLIKEREIEALNIQISDLASALNLLAAGSSSPRVITRVVSDGISTKDGCA